MADKTKHKLIKPADKEKDKPDVSKATTVTTLQTSVAWLYKYLGVKV